MSVSISCRAEQICLVDKTKGRLSSPFLCVAAGGSTATAKRLDTLFQRRVAHEQPGEAVLEAAIDTERRQAVGHLHRYALLRAQTLQRADHGIGARQSCTSFVSAVFALRENHMTMVLARNPSTSSAKM